jgi:antitoxin CcdA
MKHAQIISGKRKPVNVTIDTGIVEAARALGLNLSRISEAALREATRQAQNAAWKRDNAEWIAAHHQWVEDHELPLERYRLF